MNWIVGVDEVGRGPAAGPVTVAAVILPDGLKIDGLTDSKLMTLPERVRVALAVKRQAIAVGIGWANHDYIDQYGLTKALNLAGNRALQQIRVPFNRIILDGIHNYLMCEVHTECRPKAELSDARVAAASVVAKVARDNYMQLLHRYYPDYGFDSHKGYLSVEHIAAIKTFGLSPVHRVTWGDLYDYGFNGGDWSPGRAAGL